MSRINGDPYDQLCRVLQAGVQSIGLPVSGGTVLAAIYFQQYRDGSLLSAKDISRITGLSQSSVSTLCSRLESQGVLACLTDDTHRRQGRRNLVYSLRLEIHEFLQLGIIKYLNEVRRILLDMEGRRDEWNLGEKSLQDALEKAAFEIQLFLREPCATQ
ncbi:MAG: MarR family transcriptional regulator [Candidatus Thorarchaeota archaeon]|jgi:DNA-binding transcriptional regulator GbsR (MarR family)